MKTEQWQPDWKDLDQMDPRDRALGFRQAWSDEDRMNSSIDNMKVGDTVWRADPIGLRIEEGSVITVTQVRLESNGDTFASKTGAHVMFTAAFGSYGAYQQTYQWQFFATERGALIKLKGLADQAVTDAERALNTLKAKRDLIHRDAYEVRRYDKSGRILRDPDA